MKRTEIRAPAAPPQYVLQQVVDRVTASTDLSDTRKRDLRSSIVIYGKIIDAPLTEIPLDLAAIRKTFDGVIPLQAKVSRKRWANLRSDLAAAIAASGLHTMLKTSNVKPTGAWAELIEATKDKRITHGLSRLARWASSLGLRPTDISDSALERFFGALEAQSLIHHLSFQRRNIPRLWNRLVALSPQHRLHRVEIPEKKVSWHRISWDELPKSFRKEVEEYLTWCAASDPLNREARARALAPQTLRLRRHYIHLAATAACEAGVKVGRLTSLRKLVEPEVFRSILRNQ